MITQKILRISTGAACAVAVVLFGAGFVADLPTSEKQTLVVVGVYALFAAAFLAVTSRIVLTRSVTRNTVPDVKVPAAEQLPSFDEPIKVHPVTGLPMIGGVDARGTPPTGMGS